MQFETLKNSFYGFRFPFVEKNCVKRERNVLKVQDFMWYKILLILHLNIYFIQLRVVRTT